MEKMINEFKVTETEDGFRIEIKGNKAAIRQMLDCFGFCDMVTKGAPINPSFCFDSDFWSQFGDWCGVWPKPKEKNASA
jgi:hypothetical protein